MKDINILLINPSAKQIYKYEKHGSSVLPSLGLLQIAQIIRETGASVEYVDFEIEDVNIADKVERGNYLFVGITGTTPLFPAMHQIAKEIKEANSSIPVIVGGPHSTLCYEDILQYDIFDAAIIGEGEEIIKAIIECYKKSNNIREILKENPFIAVRGKKKVKNAIIKNLNSLPFPAYDIINFEKYSPSIHRADIGQFATIITSRSCPFKCEYCKTLVETPYRYQNVKKVLEQVKYLVNKISINYLQFWDDTFTLKKKRAIEISKGIKKYAIKWSINTRVDCINEVVLQFLKEGGCTTIFYGVESSNEQILEKLNRKIKLEKIKSTFALTKDYGIKTVAGCILGLPYDTPKQILDNIHFIQFLEPDFVHFSIYSPNPETYLQKTAIEMGYLPSKVNWLDCSQYEGPPMGMPTCNPYLGRKELQELLYYAYSLFPSCEIKTANKEMVAKKIHTLSISCRNKISSVSRV
jgi:anaerobic magnesium-protoporphyrin IX monomethyl ester cyclase